MNLLKKIGQLEQQLQERNYMKILHCSDIHLGKRPFGNENFSQKRYEDYYKAFDQLADKAIENKIDVFMVTGDLFDKRDLSPDNLRRSEIIFEKLKNNGIKVLLIEGNHDNSNKFDVINSWLHYLEEKKYALRLTYEKEGENYIFTPFKVENVNFYGLGYPGFNADKVVEELSMQLNPNEKNVILIHTAIGGGEGDSLPGLIKSETLKLLKDKVIYVGGGHFHSMCIIPKENPYFFIPGSSEYWNVLNEKSSEKGAFIFDTETLKFDFIKINPRKRIIESFILSENIEESFIKFAENLNLTGEELVIVKVEISNNLYINSNDLEKILEENGALKAYIVPIFKNIFTKETLQENNNSLFDIESNVISTWEGFGKGSVINYLQDLKDYQSSDIHQENFLEVFDKMLEELLNNENN